MKSARVICILPIFILVILYLLIIHGGVELCDESTPYMRVSSSKKTSDNQMITMITVSFQKTAKKHISSYQK